MAECDARKPWSDGDVLVRTKSPRTDFISDAVGGGWVYNHVSHACQTSADNEVSTLPAGDGYCVQLALASDNPGYDVKTRPAPRLRKVIASKGSCSG